MDTKPFLLLGVVGLLLATQTRPLAAAEGQGAGVAIVPGAGSIDFLLRGELVTRYHISAKVAKPYFWPLNAPGGIPMTRAWPMEKGQTGGSTDHVHQKSVWFAHGDVIPEGIAVVSNKTRKIAGVDFWTEEAGHGRIVCTDVDAPVVTAGHGQVATHNEWRTADGVKLLDETRVIHLYDPGEAYRLVVIEIDLHATVAPITFGDTDEGTMGVRVSDALAEQVRLDKERKKGTGRLENAEGKTGEKGCWGMVSAWCDDSGPIDGRAYGLAILADPANPYPSCWQSRNYGLMAANPFAREHSGYPAMKGRTDLVKLPKGEHLKLRYGLLIHPGDAAQGKVAEQFERFAGK
jgi:hypothetical protein